MIKGENRYREYAHKADEWDVASGWRKVVSMKRSRLRAIKRRMNRRNRRRARQRLEREGAA